ncbi:MAG: hypothetical protein EOM80_12475 [Erysipelotrichia bacterium]|nr:hypothetical protein [Erysipelotrichia bacterium]
MKHVKIIPIIFVLLFAFPYGSLAWESSEHRCKMNIRVIEGAIEMYAMNSGNHEFTDEKQLKHVLIEGKYLKTDTPLHCSSPTFNYGNPIVQARFLTGSIVRVFFPSYFEISAPSEDLNYEIASNGKVTCPFHGSLTTWDFRKNEVRVKKFGSFKLWIIDALDTPILSLLGLIIFFPVTGGLILYLRHRQKR